MRKGDITLRLEYEPEEPDAAVEPISVRIGISAEGGSLHKYLILIEEALTELLLSNYDVPGGSRSEILVDYLWPQESEKEVTRRTLMLGSPLYERAFHKVLINMPRTPEEEGMLAVGMDATGEYAVPASR